MHKTYVPEYIADAISRTDWSEPRSINYFCLTNADKYPSICDISDKGIQSYLLASGMKKVRRKGVSGFIKA